MLEWLRTFFGLGEILQLHREYGNYTKMSASEADLRSFTSTADRVSETLDRVSDNLDGLQGVYLVPMVEGEEMAAEDDGAPTGWDGTLTGVEYYATGPSAFWSASTGPYMSSVGGGFGGLPGFPQARAARRQTKPKPPDRPEPKPGARRITLDED